MRGVLAILSLCMMSFTPPGYEEAPFDESKWVTATSIAFPKERPNYTSGVFFNSFTGVGAHQGEWITEDLTGRVPEGTKAVFLSGIAIITHGTTRETADLQLSFRRTGSEEDARYLWQVCETDPNSGQRSGIALWVSLNDDLCFDWRAEWPERQIQYPCFSAYGLNLCINAFAK